MHASALWRLATSSHTSPLGVCLQRGEGRTELEGGVVDEEEEGGDAPLVVAARGVVTATPFPKLRDLKVRHLF